MLSRSALLAWLRGSAAAADRIRGAAAGGNVRLAMVTDVGGLGDRSFNDSAYRGLKAAQRELHADIAVLQSRSAADYQPNLTVLANKDYDEIFADRLSDGPRHRRSREPLSGSATSRSSTRSSREPNVASVTFREQEGSFLAGAAAAMATKTKTIAFMGGIDIPLLRKFEAGYAAGARQIDPGDQGAREVRRLVRRRRRPARSSPKSCSRSRRDVIYTAAGKAGLGAIERVKTRRTST